MCKNLYIDNSLFFNRVRLESSLSDEEKSKRDNERRKLARANAIYFEKIHPSLVDIGLEGKFVLIDNKNVWGISGNRRDLERCYNSVHREGGFDMFCYQIYRISAQEVKEQLEREKAREKARKMERIRRAKRQRNYESNKKTSEKKPKSYQQDRKSRKAQRKEYASAEIRERKERHKTAETRGEENYNFSREKNIKVTKRINLKTIR